MTCFPGENFLMVHVLILEKQSLRFTMSSKDWIINEYTDIHTTLSVISFPNNSPSYNRIVPLENQCLNFKIITQGWTLQ